MKKNYHLDDFETFLSDSADKQRMYPSDRVWRNIDKELHGQKKWPALTFGALLTGAIITAGLILVHPDKNLLNIQPQKAAVPNSQVPSTNSGQKVTIADNTANNNRDLVTLKSEKASTTSKDLASANYQDFAEASVGNDISKNGNNATVSVGNGSGNLQDDYFAAESLVPLQGVYQSGLVAKYPNAGTSVAPETLSGSEIALVSNELTGHQVNQFSTTEEGDNQALPKLPADKIKNRWGIEYYFAPSYSYRYLTESKIVDLHQSQQNGPIAPNLINPVNNFVNHKPILGLEAGAGVVYQATTKLQLKAGLQLNVRGYDIEAYASGMEPSTIVLNRGYYTDSIFSLSNYSNQSGYKDVTIENRYWQISLPIGINYQITDGKKLNVSIAASVQPTYQFNNSEYILSHDYRNYVQEPSLVRRWNVNTAIGALINYNAAGVNWQVGPQIRYQALSGTASEYPIREHLLDYGLRIGVVKTLK